MTYKIRYTPEAQRDMDAVWDGVAVIDDVVVLRPVCHWSEYRLDKRESEGENQKQKYKSST